MKGFLETLPESDRSTYLPTETIDKLDTSKSIETFFLERAKQLLKSGGLPHPIRILSSAASTSDFRNRTARPILKYGTSPAMRQQ